MYGSRLAGVEWDGSDPPALRFLISGAQGGDYQIRVLVPGGHEEEARQLATRLSGRAPEPAAATTTGGGRRKRRHKPKHR